MGRKPFERRAFRKGWPAGQKKLQRATEAVDVGTNIDQLRVLDLFRRDEIGSPHHVIGAGQADVRACAGCLGQPEVQNLDHFATRRIKLLGLMSR